MNKQKQIADEILYYLSNAKISEPQLDCEHQRSYLEKVKQSYYHYFFEYLNNVTNSQVVDGLDILYEDYRNRKIMVSNAVWIVLNEIAGKSSDEMDEMIRNYRKNAE